MACCDRICYFERVSIRAPAFRPGRCRLTAIRTDLKLFQSAPRPFDRGDLSHVRPPSEQSKVSIRAPAFRPGRCRHIWPTIGIRFVSIRAPAFRPGRYFAAKLRQSLTTFQSAPRPFDRGDALATDGARRSAMFQSAPRPFDRGDFPWRCRLVRNKRFQSAPRPFDRGDSRFPATKAVRDAFQSAPRPFDRGDPIVDLHNRDLSCFNPRPGLSTGAIL